MQQKGGYMEVLWKWLYHCQLQMSIRKVFSPVLLGLVFFGSFAGQAHGAARNIVLAIDLGICTESLAGAGGNDRHDRIAALIDKSVTPADNFAIVTLSRDLRVIKSFDAKDRPGIGDLRWECGASSLHDGLRAAAALFPATPEDRENLLLVVSAGDEGPSRPLLELFSQLRHQGIGVRLYLPSPASVNLPLQDAAALASIEIGELPSPPAVENEIMAKVRKLVAERAGVEADRLPVTTRFVEDLGFDHLMSYEVVAAACALFSVPTPDGNSPETVAALADYIDGRRSSGSLAVGANMESAPVFASAAGKRPFFEQTVFFATNRKRTGQAEPAAFFDGGRAGGGAVSYGRCTVTIPSSHKKGAVETPFLGLQFFEDSSQHVQLAQVRPMTKEEFFKQIKTNLQATKPGAGWDSDVVVFIHGFNVTFADAAKRTAQMAFDFDFKGAPLMFSWPSDGKLYAYLSDREDVVWSVVHIEEFLNEVVEKFLPRKVHLVAHSMGNQGLIGALNMLALRRGAEQRPLFENIILAAPDFDAQMFQEQIAPRVRFLAKSWTVYTSDKDAALNFSTTINSSKRLGLPVTAIAGVDVIDATGVEVTPWSVPEFHSYYATKQTVIQDIVSAIKGVAPALRNLIPRSETGTPYWRLGAEKSGHAIQ
jgi:acyl carrier protein